MKEYRFKPSIDWLVNTVLKDLTINKDYIIAGGFIRDEALELLPKDIDIFVRDGVCETELDWELLVRSIPGFRHSALLGNLGDYAPVTGPGDTLNSALWTPQRRTWDVATGQQVEEPKDSVQALRTILKVEEVFYDSCSFPINFIHCTVEKGFTPENLVDTFDYNLVQGYVGDDLSLILPKDFEKARETKLVTIYHNDSPKCLDKSVQRVEKWLARRKETRNKWKIEVKAPNLSFLMDKITSPYKDFIKRNGKPFKNEQLKAYASTLPMR